MIWVFICVILSCKAVGVAFFAPEVNRRFVRLPRGLEWVVASALCNGQMLAGIVLQILQIPQSFSGPMRVFGAVAFAGGHGLHLAAMAVNPHFRPEIVKPPELCRHWLYEWLGHPGYIGLWLVSLGQTLLLGYPILAPCLFGYAGLLIYRTIREERLLCRFTREN